MTNFFKHAPAPDTYQKRFLEAMRHRQHVIASFPLAYAGVSLYALAAMMGEGLAVVVCPPGEKMYRNLAYFKAAGFQFPEVACLDGTQMPHEERAIHEQINRNRVRLVYVTPERFVSLTFLQILVHADVSFLAVEEAERLLPSMPGYVHYRRFFEEGLCQLRKLPPLVLLVPPLSPARFRDLSEKLKLGSFQLIQGAPLIEPIDVRVRCLMTEHQKFRALTKMLSGNPAKGKLGKLHGSGAVLIQTAFPPQAEKLAAMLHDYGFDSVWLTHYKHSIQDQIRVLEIANSRLNSIVVNCGVDTRAWSPLSEASPRLVFWTPPTGVDDLILQVFRQGPGAPAGYGEHHYMKALVFHTREDFRTALGRLRPNRYLDTDELQVRAAALKHYRRWVLSETCRLQSLAAYLQGSATIDLPPCGRCDRCLQRRTGRGPWRRLLDQWLF